MSHAPDAPREYLKNTVMTASPEQLHLMLLDGAIRFATRGLAAIKANQIEDAFNALERAQRIVLELSNGIRREVNPAIADRMTALYGFIFRRLVDGNMQRSSQAVEDALRILRHQRETWALLIEKIKKEAQASTGATAPPAQAQDEGGKGGTTRFVAEG